ncbi:PAS domain-containing protein, partial [Nonomuraea lactucae]|uniref:PAS domain-containing protein n=1 Tax=Nonomuraea lactucae TaxID=2249762 RepID=UPI000DE26B82
MVHTTRVSSRAFDGTPHAPAAARRFVRRVLAEWRLDHLAEDAVLLTGELVTNAVVHAGTGLEVTCCLDPHAVPPALEIEVDDHRPALTIKAPGGGLTLAGMLADGWGVTYTGTAKRVWVRMELPDGTQAPEAGPGRAAAPVESLHVGVVVTGADGRVVSWNPEAEALLGWPPEQAVGRPLAELVAWQDGHGGGSRGLSLADTLRLGRWRGESRMRRPDGRLVPVYVSHVRAEGAAGEGCSVWVVVGGDHRYVLATPSAPLGRETAGRIKDLLGHDRPLAELLDTIAQIVHLAAGGDASYVLLREGDRDRTGGAGRTGPTGTDRGRTEPADPGGGSTEPAG